MLVVEVDDGTSPVAWRCVDDRAFGGRGRAPLPLRAVAVSSVTLGGRRMRRTRVPLSLVLAIAAVALVAVMTAGVALGSVTLSAGEVWTAVADRLSGSPHEGVADSIVWQIRLPRVLLAAAVGAALTVAGCVVQTLVRNGLADPYLLGVSSGASVGATAVLLFGAFASLGVWALSGGAVLGALAAMVIVFLTTQRRGELAPTQLLLAGVVLSAMFAAVTSFLLFRANPQATQTVLFWLLGSFGSATWSQLPIPVVVLTAAVVVLLARGRAMNALALGPDVAASVGANVAGLRRELFVLTSLVTGACVAVSGIIGFIGLVVPHVVRLLVGSDHRRVLPTAVLVGAGFAVLGDLLARTVVAPQEMPMGVVTAFVGAPTLLWLMRRRPHLHGAGR